VFNILLFIWKDAELRERSESDRKQISRNKRLLACQVVHLWRKATIAAVSKCFQRWAKCTKFELRFETIKTMQEEGERNRLELLKVHAIARIMAGSVNKRAETECLHLKLAAFQFWRTQFGAVHSHQVPTFSGQLLNFERLETKSLVLRMSRAFHRWVHFSANTRFRDCNRSSYEVSGGQPSKPVSLTHLIETNLGKVCGILVRSCLLSCSFRLRFVLGATK
jgi:hypothetical protein